MLCLGCQGSQLLAGCAVQSCKSLVIAGGNFRGGNFRGGQWGVILEGAEGSNFRGRKWG